MGLHDLRRNVRSFLCLWKILQISVAFGVTRFRDAGEGGGEALGGPIGPVLEPIDDCRLQEEARGGLASFGALAGVGSCGIRRAGCGCAGDGNRGVLRPVACCRRSERMLGVKSDSFCIREVCSLPDLTGKKGIDGVQPIVEIFVVEGLDEIALVLRHNTEGVLDQLLLVVRIFGVRLREVDQAALARIALVPEKENVRAAHDHPPLLPNLEQS